MVASGWVAAGATGYVAAGRRHTDPLWELLGVGASVDGPWRLLGRRARPAAVVEENEKWWMDRLVETPLGWWGMVVVIMPQTMFYFWNTCPRGRRRRWFTVLLCHHTHSSGAALVATPLLSLW